MEERTAMKEGVVVLLLDNGELSGLLDDAQRSPVGMTYELVLAERRLVEDLSGRLCSNIICCTDMSIIHSSCIHHPFDVPWSK